MNHECICRIPGRTGAFRLTYEDGAIKLLKPVKADNIPDNDSNWLTAGLFDIQVNGMIGHYLSSDDLDTNKVLDIDRELEKRGILFWCPTICSQEPAIVAKNLKIINKAIEQKAARGIFGIHLEGHYISDLEGYRGVHSPKFIRDPVPQEFDYWQEAAGGNIRLFSLAPERKGAIKFIEKLRNQGVKVGLVHHAAKHDTVLEAVASGADLASHLINGCTPLIHRQHNVIWSQLSIDEMWASFIGDGHHIPYYTLRAAIKAKGIDKSILISDLFYLSGLPEGEYISASNMKKVVLKDGGLWIKGEDMLCGAARTLEQDIDYVVKYCNFSIEDALIMASINPARYFGIEHKMMIYPGRKGPLAIFLWKNDSLKGIKILK
ncbi:MAG: N-acetylglucosamine-6-phosphate deacetylase [Actinomycetota bacterium]